MEWGLYKIMGVVASVWAVASTAVYFPIRNKANDLEKRMQAIEIEQAEQRSQTSQMKDSVDRLTEVTERLARTLQEQEAWRNRMIGAGHINGDERHK